MLTLALDTSGGSAVALVRTTHAEGRIRTEVLARARSEDPRAHAERLAPMIAGLLEEAEQGGLGPVGRVVAGTGPAPFTGLRAGLVTARAFARGRGLPLHGLCSLDALARQALDAGDEPEGGDREVLVVTDARRREVYWARYRAAGRDDVARLRGPEVASPTEAAAQLPGAEAAGSGTALHPELLPAAAQAPTAVDPAVLARMVAARLARHERGEPLEELDLGLEPRYLRRPDAQLPGAAKRVS